MDEQAACRTRRQHSRHGEWQVNTLEEQHLHETAALLTLAVLRLVMSGLLAGQWQGMQYSHTNTSC
jgi:hypothetical protein